MNLVGIADNISGGERDTCGVMKLEWNSDESLLIFKKLEQGEVSFKRVMELRLSKEEAASLLRCITECLRNNNTCFDLKSVGDYDINISCHKSGREIRLKLGVMESRREKSRIVGEVCYNMYMSGMTLLDGIRSFRSKNGLA